MSNPFSQAVKQAGGLAKHVAKRVVQEPMEVLRNSVGKGDQKADQGENQAMQMVEQAAPSSQSGGQGGGGNKRPAQPKGFKTQQDFQKYQQLSPKKDELELALIRKQLAKEWGVEQGMQRARAEYEQKEEQRKQVEEKEEEEKKVVLEQKKKENMQVKMAKNASSAERRMSVAG